MVDGFQIIRKWYSEILNREPDKGGIDFYLPQLKDGKLSEEELIKILRNSKEFQILEFEKMLKENSSNNSVEPIFSYIYKMNLWDGKSRSGPGSDLTHTKTIRTQIPSILKEFGIKSLSDIPCGDFYWLKEIPLDQIQYIGIDIVSEIIHENNKKYETKFRHFLKLDILSDNLPNTDLILCRDLFVHFLYKHIFEALKNIKKAVQNIFSPQILVQLRLIMILKQDNGERSISVWNHFIFQLH